MIVYRLTKSKFQNDLSGIGAQLYVGRWNSNGSKLIYAATNIALCTAEVAVHLPLGILPKDYVLQTVKIPDLTIEYLEINHLPAKWNTFPYHTETKIIGDTFITPNTRLLIKVPTALVQGEFNYLVNPNHPKAKEVKIIKIADYHFDRR